MDARVDLGDSPWRAAGLMPIYAAIGVLIAVALAGFAVALWPQASAPSTGGAREAKAVEPGFERKLRFAPDGAPHIMRWM